MKDDQYIKIAFEMEQDEDGWPPITTETLWAVDLGNGKYEINNIPFFVRLLARGDIVSAYKKYGDMLYFKDIMVSSKNSTIRIIFNNKRCINDVYKSLESYGCSTEGGADYKNLTAVDIPENVSFQEVVKFLKEQENKGIIGFEESCISEHHKNQYK
jgi:hypothetical protein